MNGGTRTTPGFLERVLWLIAAAVILTLAFFFLAVALIVAAVLAAFVLARWWWLNRKLGKAAQRHVITAEYTVVERESPGDRRPPPPGP